MSDTEDWKVNSETVGGSEYRYSATWINELESESHWRRYWKQQDLLKNYLALGESVMEIGVGSGFTANYLRSKGYSVTTFDIDAEKQPDILGNIVTHDFDETFDHILSFEIFEHIPYNEFVGALPKIRKLCRKSLCFSVPIARREVAALSFKFPKFNKKNFSWSARNKSIWDFHFWEIDFKGMTQEKLLSDLRANGFEPEVVENKMMRLFVGCRCV